MTISEKCSALELSSEPNSDERSGSFSSFTGSSSGGWFMIIYIAWCHDMSAQCRLKVLVARIEFLVALRAPYVIIPQHSQVVSSVDKISRPNQPWKTFPPSTGFAFPKPNSLTTF